MKGVKRMNVVIVHPNQRAVFAQCNLYTMDVDRRNRNCYCYGRFGHLARNCKNKSIGSRIEEGRRLEYGNRRMIEKGNRQNNGNLNRDRDLIVLN